MIIGAMKNRGIEMLIYIAGKYNDKTPELIEQNVQKALKVAEILIFKGHDVFCPHTHSHAFSPFLLSHDQWIDLDISILRHCDAIFLLDNWKESKGAIKEQKIAKLLNMKEYTDPFELPVIGRK